MRSPLVLSLVGCAVALASAQAQTPPPVRPLGAVQARSAEPFVTVSTVRQLPGGRVLVNEPAKRRVVMLDGSLASLTVVADSTPATATAYSGRFGGLIAWKGDSTLFVDPMAMSMMVIDPAGKLGRVMSVPRSQDAMALSGGVLGNAYFDGSGHLVYRAPPSFGAIRTASGAFAPPDIPDSAALVRVDVATRKLDTLAFIRTPKVKMNVQTDSNGRISMSSLVNPLPLVDDWSVLSDGSVAIVRGQDYHVDVIRPDGSKQSFAKMAFEWQRLSDEDKVAFMDSVKAQRARMAAAGGGAPVPGGGVQINIAGGPPGAAAAGAAAGAARAEGGQRIVMMGDGPMPAGGARPPQMGAPQLQFISPSELPDYKPPFFANSTKGDAEGNLWIRTIPTKQRPGGPVYDVVNAKGELVDRVQLPANRTIVGFGPGVVYLLAREGEVQYLERAGIR